MNDRGVSQTVGFVLVFSIMVLSVGLVYTSGNAALTTITTNEKADTAERAIEGVAMNFDALQRGDPARTSELRLQGGTLAVKNDSVMTVTVGGPPGRSYTMHPGSLVFRMDDEWMAYEAGATFRGSENGVIMTRRPSVICDANQAVVAVTVLRGHNTSAIGGDSSAVIAARTQQNELLFPTNGSTNASDATSVRVSVSSDRTPAWERYFADHPDWQPAGSEYECTTERVYVRWTVVSVQLRG